MSAPQSVAELVEACRELASELGFALAVVAVDNERGVVAYCTNISNRDDACTVVANLLAAFKAAPDSTFRRSPVKCGTAECAELATTRAYWPGHPIDFCDACAERAARVAKVMGFELALVRTDGAS